MMRCLRLVWPALVAGVLLLPSPVMSGELAFRVRGVELTNPPPLISTAVVKGSEMLLAGGSSGLRRIDMKDGRDLAQVSLEVSGAAEPTPMYLASGPGGVAVSGVNQRWYFLDDSYRVTRTLSNRMMGPLGSCLLLGDRIIVYGAARAERTGSGLAWLFVQYQSGAPLPLAEYDQVDDIRVHIGQFHIRQITQGGVARLPKGGWVAVDPLDYSIRVFDQYDRMVRGFEGRSSHFRKPDIAAYPDGRWNPGERTAYYAWLQAQTQVKRPVALGGDLIGVVVGVPSTDGLQRHELDVYRLDGSVVAVGVPIPELEVGRLIVADAEPGRLVVLTQETSWPFGAPTMVWEVEISGLPGK